MQPSRGLSIHIGLNHVDPACYSGWDGALAGCINDANDMKAIADRLGYRSLLLTDAQATANAVIAQVGQAARTLTAGDIFLLTYSGHGGQVPDVNGDEDDNQDETLVLFDRQLIDDELYALWGQFAAGVRIVMLSDSCHSGTVMRMLTTYNGLREELARRKAPPSMQEVETLTALARALGIEAGEVRAVGDGVGPEMPPAGGPPFASVKTIPGDIRALVNAAHAADDATRQWVAGASERANVQASVLLISGCQDSQVSLDGARNGLFTEKLKQVWNGGAFAGDYARFAADIRALMPASQQPNLGRTGAPDAAFDAQTPFTIGASANNGNGGTTPQPSPTPSQRPTLRRGMSGADVRYLQQRLQFWGHSVTADGSFGPMTESAVRSFQFSNGLTGDGIVGPATWLALG